MVHDGAPVELDSVAARRRRAEVADAGSAVAGTLAEPLGIAALVDERLELGERPGAANASGKVMTLARRWRWAPTRSTIATLLRARFPVPPGPPT